MATLYNFGAYTIPESTTQSASGASYTVPSGYFAVATANVHAGETFSVNGTAVLTSSEVTWSAIASNVSPRVYTGYYSAGTTPNAKGMLAHVSAGAASAWTSPVDQGDMFTNSTSRARTSVTGTFRLKAGDYISGARYHVEVYKIPA